MKLSDITIYKSRREFWSPFILEDNPSVKTKSFLLKLLNDPYFIESVVRLRKKYKIPENGYLGKMLLNYDTGYRLVKLEAGEKREDFQFGQYNIRPLAKKMRKDIDIMLQHYKYAKYYGWLLFLLISHNAFVEVAPENLIKVEYYSGKENLIELLRYHQDPVAGIIISSHITKEQFKKWIDANWEAIEYDGQTFNAAIGNNLEYIMPKPPKERGTLKSLKIDEAIIPLLNQNKTNTEIGKQLIQLFPEEDKVFGQDWVNLHISRLKKRLLKL